MFLSLVYDREESLCDDEEPSRFIYAIKGKIYTHSRSDRRIKVGEFNAFQVNAERCVNEQSSLFDALDTYASTVSYFGLYEDDLSFPPNVLEALGSDGFWDPNMLIIDRLVIGARFRGRNFGLLVMHALMVRFAMGCGIVAIKPYPLQYEGGTPDENQDDDFYKKAGLSAFAGSFEDCTSPDLS